MMFFVHISFKDFGKCIQLCFITQFYDCLYHFSTLSSTQTAHFAIDLK